MRIVAPMFVILCCFAVLPGAAEASYVFFHKQLGAWTILCWDDRVSGTKQCSLYAPRASLTYRSPPNVLQIHEYAPNTFQVVIMLRDRPMPDLPAFVRIDGFKVHETAVEPGLARRTGSEAAAIIGEMRKGRRITARIQTIPDGLPRDTRISLEGFDDALATYRRTIRAQGILK